MQIEPQWIDYNGHLNMAYYNVMFDRAIDELWLQLGIGPNYLMARKCSTFTAECHVRYVREIQLGDPVQVSILIVGGRRKAHPHVQGIAARDRRLALGDVGKHDAAYGHDGAQSGAVSVRHRNADLHAGSMRRTTLPRSDAIGRRGARCLSKL